MHADEVAREFENEHSAQVVTSVIFFSDPQDYIFHFVIADTPEGLYEAWMRAPYGEDEYGGDEEGVWKQIGRPKELIWDCLNDVKKQWKKIAGEY